MEVIPTSLGYAYGPLCRQKVEQTYLELERNEIKMGRLHDK